MKTILVGLAALASMITLPGCEHHLSGATRNHVVQSATLVSCGEDPDSDITAERFAHTWRVIDKEFHCPARSDKPCHMGTRYGDMDNKHSYFLTIERDASRSGVFNLVVIEREPFDPDDPPDSKTVGAGTVVEAGTALELAGEVRFKHGIFSGKKSHHVTLTLRQKTSKRLCLDIVMQESKVRVLGTNTVLHDGSGHADD